MSGWFCEAYYLFISPFFRMIVASTRYLYGLGCADDLSDEESRFIKLNTLNKN